MKWSKLTCSFVVDPFVEPCKAFVDELIEAFFDKSVDNNVDVSAKSSPMLNSTPTSNDAAD